MQKCFHLQQVFTSYPNFHLFFRLSYKMFVLIQGVVMHLKMAIHLIPSMDLLIQVLPAHHIQHQIQTGKDFYPTYQQVLIKYILL